MREFTQFATGIGKGLFAAYTSDIDVFLLFTAGGLIGTSSRPLRAFGGALGVYTLLRRTDGYVAVTTSKIHMLSQVIADSNKRQRIFYPPEEHGRV